MKELEMLVFRVIQDRAVMGYPNVRPDVDEIVQAAKAYANKQRIAELEAAQKFVPSTTAFQPLYTYADQEAAVDTARKAMLGYLANRIEALSSSVEE